MSDALGHGAAQSGYMPVSTEWDSDSTVLRVGTPECAVEGQRRKKSSPESKRAAVDPNGSGRESS